MEWLTIIKLIVFVLVIASSSVPALIAFVKNRSKRRKAEIALAEAIDEKSKAEAIAAKEKADAELMQMARDYIEGRETTLKGFDAVMRTLGNTAGLMKKDLVFIMLQAYALQHNYEFDNEEWSKIIDDLVSFTKHVNVK